VVFLVVKNDAFKDAGECSRGGVGGLGHGEGDGVVNGATIPIESEFARG
jgi:hypothetical protein